MLNRKIIGHKTTMGKNEAKRVAKENSQSDPDWTYFIQPTGDNVLVGVRDENGVFLGYL